MICIRCDRAILPGESYSTHQHDAPSTGGCTNYSHEQCPDRRSNSKLRRRSNRASR